MRLSFRGKKGRRISSWGRRLGVREGRKSRRCRVRCWFLRRGRPHGWRTGSASCFGAYVNKFSLFPCFLIFRLLFKKQLSQSWEMQLFRFFGFPNIGKGGFLLFSVFPMLGNVLRAYFLFSQSWESLPSSVSAFPKVGKE